MGIDKRKHINNTEEPIAKDEITNRRLTEGIFFFKMKRFARKINKLKKVIK